MKFTQWKNGDWNAICDVCGFKYKASDLRKRWDGLMVCSKDFELRHPQDLIRPLPDQQKLPWTRPEASTDIFVTPACTVSGRQGIAGLGIAGCMIASMDYGVRP